jgi:DNA (cytosine-5)-methyltransferase 1
MKYISICSGIEAATVAFHGFGWTPLAFSEIEAFPSAVLAARWPQVPNLGDMTKFAEWPEEILAECDLLVGGPPCQAFSVAGLRKSLDDDRGNITLAYVRLLNHIDEVRKRHGRPPAIALYENVPGLLSTKDNAFGCLIGALAGCDEAPETETGKWPKAGYVCGETRRVGYRILDAQFFGVAQRRRRIFLVAVPCELVASLGDNACPSEILSLRESMRGNPPSRSKAGQGAASGTEGRPRGGGEPCYLDRAMFNQGVNAQYKPQITQDGVAGSMVARGPAAVGISGQCAGALDSHYFKDCGSAAFGEREVVAAIVPDIANPLTHRMHKGMNTTVDEGQTPIITTGGVFDEATCFKPSHFTRGKDGKPSDVTPPLSADADKGDQDTVVCATGQRTHALTTRAACEEDGTGSGNPIVPTQAVGFNWQNGGGYGKANDGLGITEEGTGPLQRCNTPAVAFKPGQSEAAGGTFVTEEFAPTMQSQNNGSTAVPAVAYVKATNPHSKEEAPRYEEAAVSACLNGWDERHDPPKHMVACNVYGGNCRKDRPNGGFYVETDADSTKTLDSSSGLNPAASQGGVAILTKPSSMQVRRLTPSECEFLQGFPAGHTDITFRKKPAADGPRYRALGNSMAVPCMVWLGHRITHATKGDNT